MKDLQTKGTGNSRFLKTSLDEGITWEQALAMLRSGTFPIDLNGFNSEGIETMGTLMNKSTILTDELAASLGLDQSDPNILNVFTKLKEITDNTYTLLAKKMVSELGQAGANLLEWANAQAVGGCFYINPTVTTADVPIVTWYAGLLEINGGGRRMIISTSGGGLPITYVNVTSAGVWSGWQQLATATDLATKVSKSGDTMTGDLTVANRVGIGDCSIENWKNGEFTIVNTDRNAQGKRYLDILDKTNCDDFDASLKYVESLGSAWDIQTVLHTGNAQSLGFPKIAIGSYTGTGTYGANSPNTLNLGVVPKLVLIMSTTETKFTTGAEGGYANYGIFDPNITQMGAVRGSIHVSFSGTTLSWYADVSSGYYPETQQLNKSGVVYKWYALY